MTKKNRGGAQFYAVASVSYEKAQAQKLGNEVPTEWFLQDIGD